MKKLVFIVLAALSLYAGVYEQKLRQCFIDNSTPNDIKTLKTWMFFAFAHDNDLQKYANIPVSKQTEINKAMGKYITKLLGEKCVNELRLAIKYEGKESLNNSFEYLGTVAAGALLSSPQVNIFLKGYIKYVDLDKVSKALR